MRNGNRIALTFDDGPNEPATIRILETLKYYGVKATFFEVAANIEYYRMTAQKVVQEGHTTGIHGYCHSRLLAFKRYGEIVKELLKAQEVFFKITGKKPALFRPPFGYHSPWLLNAATKVGLSPNLPLTVEKRS